MAKISKSAVYNVSPDKLYAVITDYPSYPQFMDGVDEAQIIEQTPEGALVEYSINIIKKFTYRLRSTHQAPHKVSWTLDSGDLFKKSEGSWALKDLGDGKTEITYSLDIDFKFMVPKMVVNKLIKNNLPKMFENVYQRAKSLENPSHE